MAWVIIPKISHIGISFAIGCRYAKKPSGVPLTYSLFFLARMVHMSDMDFMDLGLKNTILKGVFECCFIIPIYICWVRNMVLSLAIMVF